MKRHLTAAIASLALSVAFGTGIASAQTVPNGTQAATDATTVAQATPRPAPRRPPIVVLHVGGMATYNVGSSDLPLPSTYCATTQDCGPSGQYQFAEPVAHFDYGAQINVTNRLYLNYLHNYIDQNIGRVGVPSDVCSSLPCVKSNEFKIPYTYQKLNDDRVDDASINYLLGPGAILAGWHQRVRMCCGNPTSPTLQNQVAWHDIYLGITGRVGPNSRYFGKWFGLTIQGQYIPHNTTPNDFKAEPSGEIIPTEGNKTHVQFTPNITFPIGDPRTSTFALYGQYTNNFDYFMNSPIMYLYNQIDYGFIKRWPPYVTLTVTNSNLYQFHSGYPYSNSDTINRNKLIMTLDIAVPL